MIYQGIEYQVRASLGRDEWVLLIYFPNESDGKATVSKFTGTREAAATAALRKIDNWLKEQKRRAQQPKRPARKSRAATTRQAGKPHHRKAAAPVCELGSNPNNMAALIRALEDGAIEFIERTKTKGPGVRLKE